MRLLKHWRPSLLVLAGGTALAAEPIVYPAKGQSAEQLQKDKGESGTWATKSTGVDPLAVAQQQASTPPAQTGPSGQRVRGAARGALAGAAVGAVAGDAGKGAAVGAAGGTVVGGHRVREQRRADEAAAADAQQNAQAQLATYTRAWQACLEGR